VLGTDGRKMSKSYGNTINVSDTEPEVRQKLKTMVTDPARIRRTDKGNPDVCPVYDFHKIFSSENVRKQVDTDCRTAAIGCIDCKRQVADAMVERFSPMWERRVTLTAHPDQTKEIVESGRQRASTMASKTMTEVKDAMKIL
jgi:tryptophanyl-tRNA synthetase